MNISISNKKTSKFTPQAKTELNEQVLVIVDKIVEEAERMEATSYRDINKIQITPRIVERATKYVIEDRIDRNREHWFIRYFCPIFQTAIATGFTVALTYDLGDYKGPVVIIGVVLYIIFLTIDLVYHISTK